jgi:antitoxin VapB
MKNEKKIAKLFMSGRSQALRLPKDFRMDGDEVTIRKCGNTLIITPKSGQEEWDEWFERFNNMPGTLSEREQPREQQEREAFNDFA